MSVVNMVVGATTPNEAVFVARVDGAGPIRVAVADNPSMTDPVFTATQAIDADGVAKVSISGLPAGTAWWWQVEDDGVLDTAVTGRFRTHPLLGQPASFRVALVGDAGLSPAFPGVAGGELAAGRVSNAPTWDTVRQLDPLMLINLGDWGYPDWGSALTDSEANRRIFYDDNLAQPNQARLWREIPWTYLWDDHDFGGNDSDGSYADKTFAATVYRERVPHYPLPGSDAIYQSWQIGRVLFVAADIRYDRSPNSDPDGPSKTMLGSAQKAWMNSVLASTDAEFLVWVMPQTWLATASDSWASFPTEQAEMIAMFGDHGWLRRMCVVSADAHMIALDTGVNSPGNIPALVCAAIDATPLGNPALYNLGGQQGRAQFGTIDVVDLGTHMTVTLSGWRGTTQILTWKIPVAVAQTAITASAQVHEFAQVVSGSHQPLFEARVLTTWQTGPDPEGAPIPIINGDVQYDATAQVLASISLTTAGVDEDTGQSRFPRLPTDLLAPYGNELWVRRGVDTGGGVLWSSLGYFRIDDAQQDEAPYGPIVLSGQDRMAHLIDARLVVARTFDPTDTVGFVFASLVGEVLPEATILFDDDTAAARLGRRVTTEESRYDVLAELADSFGKIMFWDGDGLLRVESTPDETSPVWEVNAGAGGVLLTAARRISSEGVRNGWVVTGEGGDQQVPVRAIAVDIGPTSPTRWGGRFGKRPGFYSSPLITTEEQAQTVAEARVRRGLGAPHSADFGAIPNPALRPWQPIRVTQRDGNREVHVVQTLTIPLTAAATMTGTTREKTHMVIGRVVA